MVVGSVARPERWPPWLASPGRRRRAEEFTKFVKTVNMKSATNQFGVVQSNESKWRQRLRGSDIPRPHIPVHQIQVVANMIDTN
ncbi:hypothetical protein M378DRAFT_12605 [Amanita muscaria Koide BX008]|uniref:Uncharacterized protein n=1 Tax=Amanita muscaria (strain Koide BX008) TaxID=946122 RepID=A0A0C2T869_AMAMK|nr:hypothetical protein M378DRAFT_12605 [Amanita muscaria Koide BX008]